jgi:hypothetical protein
LGRLIPRWLVLKGVLWVTSPWCPLQMASGSPLGVIVGRDAVNPRLMTALLGLSWLLAGPGGGHAVHARSFPVS